MSLKLNFLGTGSYVPEREVSSESLELRFDLSKGLLEKKMGIKKRYYASKEETSSYMGACAIKKALDQARIKAEDLDLIICASGVGEQAIPSTSVLIQKHLDLDKLGTPCFDVNSTCTSFLTAFNVAANMMHNGQYKKVVIVSTEVPSLGLNWSEFHSWPLFGDGAAAAVLEAGSGVEVLSFLHKTYSSGSEYCQIKAGGTRLNVRSEPKAQPDDFLFSMQGRKIFKAALKKVPLFMEEILSQGQVSLDDIDLIIPHQASGPSLKLMRDLLKIKPERFFEIFSDHGNQVAASIPTALDLARRSGKIKAESKVLLIGTAAGLSITGLLLRF